MSISIALVGDYSERVIAHTAIPLALKLASTALDAKVDWSWIETTAIRNDANNLAEFTAIWVVPGSPYKNMDGALTAIRFARETRRPFLGTCGGFQHALIEYARNVCGINDAMHAETDPNGNSLVVTSLLCSLVGKNGHISFTLGSQLYTIFKGQETNEEYHCNYGLNPEWKTRLEKAGIHFTGFDTEDQVRAFELHTHPFFIGTLFQPERSALRGEQHPLIKAFIEAASNR
jgi:CTP synthase (UTP-ammonia lyase)